ncbi:MAG: amidohydrolase family protein [Acidobacteriota bacterium]
MTWIRSRSVRPGLAAAVATALGLFGVAPVLAEDAAPRGPQLHALVGARVVVSPGTTIDAGTLIVRDGVIEAVGAEVAPPAGARVHELDGVTLYPGLIESFAAVDWPSSDEDDAAPVAGHENPLVRPERDIVDLGADHATVEALRGAGFTTAVLVPASGLLRGESAAVNLGAGGVRANLLRSGVAQNAHPAMLDDGYPSSLMGSVALLRQTLLDADWYADAQAAFAARPSQQRPTYDRSLEALGAVVDGSQTIVLESEDLLGLQRLAGLARELGLDALAVGSGHEWQRPEVVAALGLPLILPLDFPDAPEVGDDGPALHVGLDALRAWQQAPSNPRVLADAGVRFTLTSHRLSAPKNLHARVARAVEAGWSADAALAALTVVPAELWGLSGVAGTLEAGKMANLLEVDGDLFVDSPKIRAVWVDGRRYELAESAPPTVEPAGTWSLELIAGDAGSLFAEVRFEGEATALGGVFIASGQEIALRDVVVSGDTVRFAFDAAPIGLPGRAEMSLSVDGDMAKGAGTGPVGPFTIKGRRTASPDPEVAR